jgi:hypothetical protein
VPKTPISGAGLERNQVPLSAEITCRFRPKSGAGLLRFLQLKVSERSASAAIFSPKGPWRLSFSEALHRAFTKARFRRLGLLSMEKLVSA